MKRQKKLLVLCLAFALLLGGYGAIKVLTAPTPVADSQQKTYSLGISDSLTAMQWKYEEVAVNLSFSDNKWVSSDDQTCPLDQAAVKKLAARAAGLYATKVITDPESASAYGFDSDEAVTLTFASGSGSVTMTLGNTDPYGSSAYVMLNNDASKVYLVSSDSLTAFVVTLNDLVEKEALPAFTDVLNLQLSGKKKTSADGLFTLETVACLGACGLAPVMTVDGEVHAKMTPDAALALLEDIRKKEAAV